MKFDPYMNGRVCVDRLMDEYHAHKKLIIAVDFDDTVYDIHSKGFQFPEIWDLLKECKSKGFYIVVFTASAPERYEFITQHFKDNGIVIDSINKNPIELTYGNHGKIYYNILLDDRAGLGQAFSILNIVLQRIRKEIEDNCKVS
jgi:hypothetical protein